MSSKKNKNKRHNKQDLVPLQKELQSPEECAISGDLCESISDVNLEQKTSETSSELTVVSVSKDQENTPKKPKRNKGNKNEDTTANESISVETVNEPIDFPTKINTQEKNEVTKDETPTPPKKKNKKKKSTDQHVVENTLKDEDKKLEMQKTVAQAEIKELDTVLSPSLLSAIKDETKGLQKSEHESKSHKKKNKKKKRTESEKSDKIDEMISCTTAFQNLIDTKEFKPVETSIETASMTQERTTSIETVKDAETKLISDQVQLDASENNKSEEHKQEAKVDQHEKPKNKQKKDKHTTEKKLEHDSETQSQTKQDEKEIFAQEIIQPEIIFEKNTGNVNERIKLELTAQIAKPVEKKSNKNTQKNIETVTDVTENVTKPDNNSDIEKIKNPGTGTTVTETLFSVTSQAEIQTNEPEFKSEIQELIAPKSQPRRKKSPKNKSCDEPVTSFQEEEKKSKNDILSCPTTDKVTLASLEETPRGDSVKKEIKSRTDDLPASKSQPRRKKSPHLKTFEDPKAPLTEDKIIKADGSSNIQMAKEQVNIPCDKELELKTDSSVLTETEEIEIGSLKTDDSERSDYTPDFIEYPRCSSEQLDINKTTTIEEVYVEQIKASSSPNISVPIIESPQLVTVATTSLENMSSKKQECVLTKAPEKTDLKSKVMEVNNDMEGLRKSIEKSLAELSAIEKSEEKIELEFESSPTKIELLVNINQNTAQGTECSEKPANKKDEYPADVKSSEQSQHTEETSNISYNKGNRKNKKKGKKDIDSNKSSTPSSSTSNTQPIEQQTTQNTTNTSQSNKKEENKSQAKQEAATKGGKQQSSTVATQDDAQHKNDSSTTDHDYDPIDNFEDAMTSSTDDINKTFEVLADEANDDNVLSQDNPAINIISPSEDDENFNKKHEKVNPVSQPKNLIGHPDIPVSSNKTDYKKEKNKLPNSRQAKVKVKDSVDIETKKESKESQTVPKRKFSNEKSVTETVSVNENEEYVYKYSFRKVYQQNACHVCKKELKEVRVPCSFCSLIFYCSQKHKDEDSAQHQALCFAVSTIVHLKGQKHMYAESQNITGHNYRLLRMQNIVSCEKILKRKLAAWEQEALLYPRICAEPSCREWRQGQLKDCDGCGQISYCTDNPDHLPASHQRWCKSYELYAKLVSYQQTKGRLEPKLPMKVMKEYVIPPKMNEVLADLYNEKIDLTEMQYAALTQIATAPLTAAYCYQLYRNYVGTVNGLQKKSIFTLNVVGAELQFEADALNKWEIFFLHLRPDVKELRVVLVGSELNPSNLPLDLLGKIKLCENCRQNKRRVVFGFQDKKTYYEYWTGEDYSTSDLVCAFNPSIQRASTYNIKDNWPSTLNCILKSKVPFLVTAHTLNELERDLARIKEITEVEYKVISEPKFNTFASVRPDRNFISDDEMPLLFKNYCFMLVCGV